MRALLTLLVAANPPAVAATLRGLQPRREMAVATALAAAVAGVVALLSGPTLDVLDVTPATFQLAAAVVLGAAGLRWLVVGPWRLQERTSVGSRRLVVVPLLVPVLVTPQMVMVSTAVGSERGVAIVVVSAASAMVLTWTAAVASARPLVWAVASRFMGLGAVVLAVALASDGIRTV